MKVYTAQYSYRGKDRFDITVKSGSRCFAPTWAMVMGYKNVDLSEAQYTEQYIALMRKSYVENRSAWDSVLARKRVVLVCFCKSGDFCHRVLLAKIFAKLGAEYCGEITGAS